MRPLLREAKTRFLECFVARRVSLSIPRPMFTFTFDDVPRSALDNALPILQAAGASATFYVASYLGDPDRPPTPDDPTVFFSAADTRAVRAAGHHVGCHTYSHYSLEHGTATGLAQDAERSRRALSVLLGGEPIRHFAYPFGEVSLAAKRLLQSAYLTMRSTRPGLNAGVVDLNLLRAESVYSVEQPLTRLNSLIADAARRNAWLIFYTHSVDARPDRWGCTPDELRRVIEACQATGGPILNLAEAYDRITGFRPAPVS